MRVVEASGYHEPRDALSHDWIDYLDGHAMLALPLPNLAEGASAYLDALSPDLLVLTGGDDLGRYPRRDAAERALLEAAVGRDLPVLGVCRGLQLINHWCGGGQRVVSGHVATSHEVRFAEPGWRSIYGERVEVNSYHNIGVSEEELGDGLRATAWDEVGMVEALVHRRHAVAAVMWHPERPGGAAGDIELIRRVSEREIFQR